MATNTRTWKVSYSSDLAVVGMASWFGGPNDPDDNGKTASGVDNSKSGVMGCALPLSWDGLDVKSCEGSPLPWLPWGTMVKVTADNGKVITVPLIDVGPALDENRPIDLTPAAFAALGGNLSAGLISVSFQILTAGLSV